MSVNGAEPGDRLSAESDSVRVKAVVESHVPFDHVEIIVNGTVAVDNSVAAASEHATVQRYQFEADVPLNHSSWIALRVRGGDHADVFDGPVWAHTSPVYVLKDDLPIRNPDDAEYFVEWIDQLLRVVAARNRYASAEDRQQVESLFQDARAEFAHRAVRTVE
ncbi:MAG: hypothetical protein R3C19_16175 [Planctomycetaceae bacterium]